MYHVCWPNSEKLDTPRQVNSIDNLNSSKRLHITDKNSRLLFLIDTGSDLSIIPANSQDKLNLSKYVIYAANNSNINTFGKRSLAVDSQLGRNFPWNFCIASVPYPILGADFLTHFGLSVDLKNRRLIDVASGQQTKCKIKIASITL